MNNQLLSFVLSCFILPIFSKKDVIIKSIKTEHFGEPIFATDLQIQKYNRSTYLINGKFQIFQTIDERLKMNVNVHIFMGSVKLNSLELVNGHQFCEEIKEDMHVWKRFSKSTGVASECPIEPNEYIVENYRPNGSSIPIGTPNALYEIEMLFFLDEKLQQKLFVTISVIDK